MYLILKKMNQRAEMDFTEKSIKANLGQYIETPWKIIEAYFKDQHFNAIGATSIRII